MGDDSLGGVNRTAELSHDAIRIKRHLVRFKLRTVFGEPRLLDLANLHLNRLAGIRFLLSIVGIKLREHGGEKELGIRNDRNLIDIRLIEISGIDRHMDETFLPGYFWTEVSRAETRAHGKDRVRLLKKRLCWLRRRIGCRTQAQRMRLGKCALAQQCGHDGHPRQLRQSQELWTGLRIKNTLSGQDNWALGTGQNMNGVADSVWIGPNPNPRRRRVVQLAFERLGRDIRRNFHQHGRGTAGSQGRERLSHSLGNLLGEQNLLGEFRNPGIILHTIESRGHTDRGPSGMTRHEKNGARIGERMHNASERIFRTGASLYKHNTHATTVGHPRDPVRHIAGHAFLPRDDCPDTLHGQPFEDRILRKTGDDLDPLSFQDLGNRDGAYHEYLTGKGLYGLWTLHSAPQALIDI